MDTREFIRIRLSIFFITALCVGLPTLIWAVQSLWLHRRHGGRVSVFIVSLLLSDALELLYIPYMEADLILGLPIVGYYPNSLLYAPMASLTLWGLYIHQLVVLESALFLRNPQYLGVLSSHCFAITLSVLICLCVLTFFLEFEYGLALNLLPGAITFGLVIANCVMTFKASRSPDAHIHRRQGVSVLVFALITLVFIYAPAIILLYSLWSSLFSFEAHFISHQDSMCLCVRVFRVITDPLLCGLVCREISPGNHQGLAFCTKVTQCDSFTVKQHIQTDVDAELI